MSPEACRTGAFVLAFGFRLALLVYFPTIHGGDAAARLAHSDTVILGYQLPIPQLFVIASKSLSDDPILARAVFACWGALMVSGAVALLSLSGPPLAPLFGAFLLSADPLLIHYSIVPYQEPVAYGCLTWAFYCAASRRLRLGSLLMAAACLSRFEAWLFLPLFFVVSKSRAASIVASLPAVGWILAFRGVAPSGLYVLDLDPSADRFSRVLFLGGKFAEYETPALAVAAALALLAAAWRGDKIVLRSAGALVVIMAVVVWAGHEFPPGSGRMSERLIHIPVILGLMLASTLLGSLATRSRLALALCLVAASLFVIRDLRFEVALLRAAAVDPDLALARDVARAIEAHRQERECITVRAAAPARETLEGYVAKVEKSFGDGSRARERAAQAIAEASPDRDRIAAHLVAPRGTVRAEFGCPITVVVDPSRLVDPLLPHPAIVLGGFKVGPREAVLYRTSR